MLDFERFAECFRHNLKVRSRTSKGESNTSSSPEKPQLIGDEDFRISQVDRNTTELIMAVWDAGHQGFEMAIGPGDTSVDRQYLNLIRSWAAINSQGLFNWEDYTEQVEIFGEANGDRHFKYEFDELWRKWSLGYSPVEPLQIKQGLKEYCTLITNMIGAQGLYIDLPTLLGTADYLHDGYIHPWADACGRTSVAIVMYLAIKRSITDKPCMPRYESRDAIYRGAFRSSYPLAKTIELYSGVLTEA
jgi:hypothetical protein